LHLAPVIALVQLRQTSIHVKKSYLFMVINTWSSVHQHT
jgi:hypothetical protein